jgi:hypothetical protein
MSSEITETLAAWAVERIEALEGENAALKADHESARVTWAECMRSWINRTTAAEQRSCDLEARAERLRAALEDVVDAYDFVIVDEYDRGWSSVSDAVVVARKALEDVKQ